MTSEPELNFGDPATIRWLCPAVELRHVARRLCTDGLASVIASDGHSGTRRRPITVLTEGVGEFEKLVGEERAAWMSSGVPGAIVRGERLPPEPAVRQGWGRFRRR